MIDQDENRREQATQLLLAKNRLQAELYHDFTTISVPYDESGRARNRQVIGEGCYRAIPSIRDDQ